MNLKVISFVFDGIINHLFRLAIMTHAEIITFGTCSVRPIFTRYTMCPLLPGLLVLYGLRHTIQTQSSSPKKK